MTRCVRLIMSGRVQGVCYRANTKEMAVELGLSGWVRNCLDGKVEAVFKGAPEKVEKAIDWCRQGPPSAMVTGLEIYNEEPEEHYVGFKIKY
ncbi:MAG: acylphosphatase [Proteobacteria bacterium]|nr:acylphosphatase [Pseudomonadota bacterium]